MKHFDYLIIGGGIAGTSAAETIRKLDDEGSIAIVSDEPYPIYSRLLLAKYILGQIPRDSLFLKRIEWYPQVGIDFLAPVSATSVDPQKKEVALSSGETLGFKKLLIACGGKPCKWEICQKEIAGICRLQYLDDAERIINWSKAAKKAVVVGGGFIGLELCEIFYNLKIPTVLLIIEPYVWANLIDKPLGKMIEGVLEKNGIEIRRETKVAQVLGSEKVTGIKLESGETINCDLVGVGIGIFPSLGFLEGSGIETKSGVLTNEYLETNVSGIFAAGDVCEFYDVIREKVHRIGNWGIAASQGKIAGQNMAGEKIIFQSVATHQIRVFDLPLALVGDCAPSDDVEVIDRGSVKIGKYGRLLFSQNRLVGATLANLGGDLQILQHLIGQKVPVPRYENLSDLNFQINDALV